MLTNKTTTTVGTIPTPPLSVQDFLEKQSFNSVFTTLTRMYSSGTEPEGGPHFRESYLACIADICQLVAGLEDRYRLWVQLEAAKKAQE